MNRQGRRRLVAGFWGRAVPTPRRFMERICGALPRRRYEGMNPFDHLCSWPNLLEAWHNAARGKRRHSNVAAFEHRVEENVLALQTELREGAYRPRPYTSFFIHEPKRRLISAAPIRDRVVHHALCQVIEPAFERSFIADSFANRVGKGSNRMRSVEN